MVRSSLIVSLYQRNDVPSCQHDEHREILKALQAGDRDRAVVLMMDHLDHLERELALDQQGNRTIDLKALLSMV